MAEDYVVGPGRPPKEYRFKPGQSGNPNGAKRKPPSLVPDLRKIFQRALNQKIAVAVGEHQQIMTKWAAGIEQLANQFAKGDRHARRDVFSFAEELGSNFFSPTKAFDEALASDRQEILDAYVARQTSPKASAAPRPVLAPPKLLDDDKPNEG